MPGQSVPSGPVPGARTGRRRYRQRGTRSALASLTLRVGMA